VCCPRFWSRHSGQIEKEARSVVPFFISGCVTLSRHENHTPPVCVLAFTTSLAILALAGAASRPARTAYLAFVRTYTNKTDGNRHLRLRFDAETGKLTGEGSREWKRPIPPSSPSIPREIRYAVIRVRQAEAP